MPFLAFSSGQWGAGAAPTRAGIGSDLMCLLVFFQNSHHTHFFLPVAKSRVLSYRKMPHQGNSCVWPGKLPCPLGQGVWWGVVSRLTSRLAGQFSSWASKETPAGEPSAFYQSRWSRHTWIQDTCFSPREKGCAKHSLVSFFVEGLVWLLNF